MCKDPRRRLAIAALVASLLRFPASAAPLPQPAQPAAEPATTPAELAIPARDIPARADVDERYARDVEAHAQQTGRFESLRTDLDVITASVANLTERLRARDLYTLPSSHLQALERRWKFYGGELEGWRRGQQRVVDEYADEAAQIESRREAWNATIAPENAEGTALALRARIDEVLTALVAADRAIDTPMALQLALGRRASSLQSTIDAGLAAVDAAVDEHDRRLWRIDVPPLWQVWRSAEAAHGPLSAAYTGIDIDRQFLGEYTSASRDRLRAHAAFAVLLLPALLWLSRRSKRSFAIDPELASSGQALTRPISSWLVLVLLGALFFERDGPLLLQEAALLLAVIPVLRLLPKRLFDVFGPWPYAATALYVLQRLGFSVVGDAFWHRIHLLVVTLLTFGVLAWLLLRGRNRASAGTLGGVQRTARNLGWLALGLLAVSMILNVLGNVSLADVLTEGTLDSGYIGLALLAGTSVLNAIVRLVVAHRNESRFKAVSERAGPLLQALARLINAAALVVWIVATLNSFRIWRPVMQTARTVLTYPVGVGKISLTLGSVLLFVGAVYVAFWIARSMRTILSDEVLPKMALPRGVANSVATLTYYALVLLGLLVALAAAGFEISQFAIVFGALGVGIGFGLQNVVNNFVSGLILMFERPIQPGDVVEITGTSGTVREIGMRATTLTTFEGADVVVPNGTLLSEKLINWTLSDMNRRIDVNVGVAYGSDPRRVIELLAQVTAGVPGITPTPAPAVIFAGFGANSLDFGIRAWTNNFSDWVKIRTELSLRVYDALRSAGLEIPFPQHDVHIRSIAPEARPEAQVSIADRAGAAPPAARPGGA